MSLTRRGRVVFLFAAALAQVGFVAIDYQVHDIMLATLESLPILVWAACANYRSAVLLAAITAVVAAMFETQPEPQPLTNPSVGLNAAIFFCGYLIALGLLRAVSRLTKRMRVFLADFDELKAAHDDLLPEQLPALGDWEFSVVHVPRRDVGGNFYDVALWKGGLDLFVSGASGSPIRAAMILSALKGLWLSSGSLPPASLRILDERLQPLLKGDTAVRAWYGKLYDNGIVRYASAGFPAPFLISTDGSVRRLAGGGLSLGAASTSDVVEAMYMLDGGTTLILGNDGFCALIDEGIVEPEDVLRGVDRLQAHLRSSLKDRDVLAIVVRRKTSFSFSRSFEVPVFNADDPASGPSRLFQPRNSPKTET